MIIQLTNLNWIGVLIAFVAYFVLGALWFTLFFSKIYKVSLGKDDETLPNSAIFIIGPAICSFVITLATAILMYSLSVHSIVDSIQLALVVGIGYLVANTINIAINPNMPKPILYGMISGGYHLVGITLVCLILYGMK